MEKMKRIQIEDTAHKALKSRAALKGEPMWRCASRIIKEAVVVRRRSYHAKINQ